MTRNGEELTMLAAESAQWRSEADRLILLGNSHRGLTMPQLLRLAQIAVKELQYINAMLDAAIARCAEKDDDQG